MAVIEKTKLSSDNRLYTCRAYLFINYHLLDRSAREIAEEVDTNISTIYFWLKKLNILCKHEYPERSEENKKCVSLATRGKAHPLFNKHRSEQSKQRLHKAFERGKGTAHKKKKSELDFDYHARHKYIKRRKTKPEVCKLCGKKKRLVCSCIDHTYSLNIEDYWYICYKCHYRFDHIFNPRK